MMQQIKYALAGFCMGLAEIIPGISGSTIAVIFKIYKNLMSILSELKLSNISLDISKLSQSFQLKLSIPLLGSMLLSIALFSRAIQDPQGDLEKHSIFKPVSKAEKLRKPAPRASKKHQKSTLESPINDFCENMVFAIPSMRKPCFKSSNCQ
mgnify:CR=1 FL=1